MKLRSTIALLVLVLLIGGSAGFLQAQPQATADDEKASTLMLFDGAADNAAALLKPDSNQVSFEHNPDAQHPGVDVTITSGDAGYPGLRLVASQPWDLSAHGYIEARILNTGNKPMRLSLRVDNDGDWKQEPWNTESATIKPGEVGAVRTIFGYSQGYKPGFALNPKAVVRVILFAGKSKEDRSFRLLSIQAGGKPGQKPPTPPGAVRIKPEGGIMFHQGMKIDEATQIAARNGASASLSDGVIGVTFPAGKQDAAADFKPPVGRWDLRDALQVVVTVRNDGAVPLTPRARLSSQGGPTDWASTQAPLTPGESVQIIIPFKARSIWDGSPNSGDRVTSNNVSAVVIAAQSDKPGKLSVTQIVSEKPPLPPLPEWLGKRPPVEGDWSLTFSDEFDADAIDTSRWNIYTANYWDKRTHFSRNNVLIKDGKVHLRLERRRGHHNDDPQEKQTDYATGFLDTYGKWTQLYGYFEARMKLPKAPGMWPAFWLMPDRGVEAGPQWKRASTHQGGMEVDIMEYLSGWGPHRYNIAFHWDGYEKQHKHLGTDKVYFQPDAQGYITAGVLWLPGSLTFYANGQVVGRYENPRVGSVQSYPIFTNVTGGWDNLPLDDAQLPDDFVIDYIRIWQRADLLSPPKP